MHVAKLSLAVNLAFPRKRWCFPEEWAPIIKKDIGLNYFEFCSDLLDPLFFSPENVDRMARRTREAVAANDLVMVDNYTGLVPHCFNLLSHPDDGMRADGMRWCEEFVRLSTKLGTKATGGHYDTIAAADHSDPKRYKAAITRLIDSMRHLASVAAAEGQEFILWEQMYTPAEAPYTLDQTKDIYERVNEGADIPIYITVDVGHTACQNYPHSDADRDPYEWLRRFADISPVVHMQQTDGGGSHHWPFTPEYNKRGIIEPQKVIDCIEESGSERNWIMFEIFHSLSVSEEQIIDDLKRTVDYWRPYVAD